MKMTVMIHNRHFHFGAFSDWIMYSIEFDYNKQDLSDVTAFRRNLNISNSSQVQIPMIAIMKVSIIWLIEERKKGSVQRQDIVYLFCFLSKVEIKT